MSVVPPEPEAVVDDVAVQAPPRSDPLTALGKSWIVFAVVAALLLGSALFGLIPAREPPPPPTVQYSPAKAVDPVKTPETSAPEVHKLLGWSYPVCPRPKDGARMYRVALSGERDAFAIWCAGEYVLLEVDASADPRVTRLARFPTRGELPGGASSLDLDLDGVLDLAFGVAPALGVVHRPGAGLFFLRGRAQGGYEIPRPLVEMPVVATLAAELDEQPGAELLVLTRGDVAAQRPGELWVFTGGTSPTRAALIPTALAPSDLALGPTREGQNELWIAATQPGSLVRLKLPAMRADWTSVLRAELPLPGLQSFIAGPRGERALYVRDLEGAKAIDDGATIKLGKTLASAEIGPASWLPGRADQRTLVAASQHGFSVLCDKPKERALPSGTRMVDASSTRGAGGEQRGLLLIAPDDPAGNLQLIVLPAELRDEASELTLRAGALETAPGEARVALE
jgi:hypothetical protein